MNTVLYHGAEWHIQESAAQGYSGTMYAAWEGPEVEAARLVLYPHRRVLCAGFGLGLVAACVALHVGGAHYVIGYEPNSALWELARDVVVNGQRMDVYHACLGVETGLARLGDAQHWQGRAARQHPEGDVPMLSLREVLARHSVRQVVLDVEGGERELLLSLPSGALDGAVVEFHDGMPDLSLFSALGLDVCYVHPVNPLVSVVGARRKEVADQ